MKIEYSNRSILHAQQGRGAELAGMLELAAFHYEQSKYWGLLSKLYE